MMSGLALVCVVCFLIGAAILSHPYAGPVARWTSFVLVLVALFTYVFALAEGSP